MTVTDPHGAQPTGATPPAAPAAYDNEFDEPTTSGLFSDYVGTVTRAYFAHSPNNADFWQLVWELDTDSADRPTHEEKLAVGTRWTSYDGGETIVRTDGGKVTFSNTLEYGKVLDFVRGLPAEVKGELSRRGGQAGARTTAAVWVGTRWHFADVVRPGKDKDGNPRDWHSNIPDQFLGFVDGAGNVTMAQAGEAVAGGQAAPTPVATPAAAATNGALAELTPDVRSRLSEVAKSSPNLDQFVAAAMQAGIVGTDVLVKLHNQAVYDALRVG